jgi:hypothetical protein
MSRVRKGIVMYLRQFLLWLGIYSAGAGGGRITELAHNVSLILFHFSLAYLCGHTGCSLWTLNKFNKGHMHHFDAEAGATPFWKKSYFERKP